MPPTTMTAEPTPGRDRRPTGAGEPGPWRLVPTSDPDAWRRALEGLPHAFAHTWESCRAMELTTGHETHLGATRQFNRCGKTCGADLGPRQVQQDADRAPGRVGFRANRLDERVL